MNLQERTGSKLVVVIAIGLAALAFAQTQAMLWLAWLVLGLGMGVGLYDTAFAALGRIYERMLGQPRRDGTNQARGRLHDA